MNKKSPSPVDAHVGRRVRMRRMMLGMSQEKLGDALGLTFQQVQKYEKGANRIGASRLQQIADILQVPVGFFFEGQPGNGDLTAVRQEREGSTQDIAGEFLATPNGLALATAFLQIKDAKLRNAIVHQVEQTAAALTAGA